MAEYRIETVPGCDAHEEADAIMCPDGRYFFGQTPAVKELNSIRERVNALEALLRRAADAIEPLSIHDPLDDEIEAALAASKENADAKK